MPILQTGKLKHRATQAPASRSELRKLAATTNLFSAPTCYSRGAAPRLRLADSLGPGARRCHDNRRPMGSGQAGRGPAPPPPLAAAPTIRARGPGAQGSIGGYRRAETGIQKGCEEQPRCAVSASPTAAAAAGSGVPASHSLGPRAECLGLKAARNGGAD